MGAFTRLTTVVPSPSLWLLQGELLLLGMLLLPLLLLLMHSKQQRTCLCKEVDGVVAVAAAVVAIAVVATTCLEVDGVDVHDGSQMLRQRLRSDDAEVDPKDCDMVLDVEVLRKRGPLEER